MLFLWAGGRKRRVSKMTFRFCSRTGFWQPGPALAVIAYHVRLVVQMWTWLSWELRGFFTYICSCPFRRWKLCSQRTEDEGKEEFALGIHLWGKIFNGITWVEEDTFPSQCYVREGVAAGASLAVGLVWPAISWKQRSLSFFLFLNKRCYILPTETRRGCQNPWG